jgi:hypothetical protein
MDRDKQGQPRPGLNRALVGLLFIALTEGMFAGCSGGRSTDGSSVNTPSSSDPPPSRALTITSPSPPTGTVGRAYGGINRTPAYDTTHYHCSATVSGWPLVAGGGSGNYSWEWSAAPGNALPAGLSLEQLYCGGGSTRCCSYAPGLGGIPTLAGTYRVIVTVTDSASPPAKVSAEYAITITSATSVTSAASVASQSTGQAAGLITDLSMYYARAGHTATALDNGVILIAGGASHPSAELYHPAYHTFTVTGDMLYARTGHTATRLASGKVLVAGGTNLGSTAELYDPATGRFSSAGSSVHYTRIGHTATLLPNGHVLLTGGNDASGTSLMSAEIYNPTTRTFALTGSMSTARINHTATLLPNGKVLIAGGSTLATAELFDPSTGHFTPTGALRVRRSNHTATMLPSGHVLLVGGYAATGGPMISAEQYSVTTGTFTLTGSLTNARAEHTATVRRDGTVLIVGGFQGWLLNPIGAVNTVECVLLHIPCYVHVPVAYEETYHPTTGKFSVTASGPAVALHTATGLPAGDILVAGGEIRALKSIFGCVYICTSFRYWQNETTNGTALLP